MNIELRQCEIDPSRDRIVLVIETDNKIYRQELSCIPETIDAWTAVEDIKQMLHSIFMDMKS